MTNTPARVKKSDRKSEIVRALSELSRRGWDRARPCDYEPLERELRALEEEERR